MLGMLDLVDGCMKVPTISHIECVLYGAICCRNHHFAEMCGSSINIHLSRRTLLPQLKLTTLVLG